VIDDNVYLIGGETIKMVFFFFFCPVDEFLVCINTRTETNSFFFFLFFPFLSFGFIL
jgi:hypothetical protein